jgi:hypothetical protein
MSKKKVLKKIDGPTADYKEGLRKGENYIMKI